MRLLFSGLICLAVCGCSQPHMINYADLLSSLTNIAQIASLDVPSTHILTSYDRTGANEDYNGFLGKTKNGQCILADLEGPGVISRFWFTSDDQHKTKIHFYFDNETAPRLSFTWAELDQGLVPLNIPPLAMTEQICWRSYLPIPYNKRLLITIDDAGYAHGTSPKFYYQINWNHLPRGKTVGSFSLPLLQENRALIARICSTWESMSFAPIPNPERKGLLLPGGSLELFSSGQNGTIHGLSINPDVSKLSPMARVALLRDLTLKIYWDGQSEPSVSVPFGDFFGSTWQRWAGRSMLFGTDKGAYFCCWPMPFRKSASVVIENQGTGAIPVRWAVVADQNPVPSGVGYFHAAFNRSGVDAKGVPHIVLKTSGDGKYVGCILGVWSADNSFWVLESDETMYVDEQKKPCWQGTGLEDYFNAGWYYRKVFARPLHGLPVKSPFRTVQYRLHLDDAVLFDKSFSMTFERGPNQASRALYDSVAFYYLKTPRPASGWLGTPAWRVRPRSRLEQMTLMTDLWNLERFCDLSGEIDYIEQYLEQYKPPFSSVLELRRLICRYKNADITRSEMFQQLEAFLISNDAAARSFAEIYKRFYSEPSTFLLGAYCNMASEVFLDGQRMLTAGNPEQIVVVPVKLENGLHVIAVKSAKQQYPSWMQAWLESPAGLLTETTGWKHAVNPSGDWAALHYDDSGWNPAGYSLEGVKSPPEVPYVWVAPDPYVNASSKTLPVCPGDAWDSAGGFAVYRKVFEIK